MPSRISAELAQLARLARDGGLDLSQVSLRVKADLLLSTPQPPAEDIAAFSELATALIPSIDETTATILARKLAGWRHAPDAVLQALRARGGEVLAALLRHGAALPPVELEEIAAHGEGPTVAALAERADLPAAASLMLAGRNERALDLALIANPAPLPRATLDLLLARARSDAGYGPGLLARRDLSESDLIPLFLQAGPERRLAMLDSLAAIEALGPTERRPSPDGETFEGWLLTAGQDPDGIFGVIANHLGAGQALTEAMAQDRSRDLTALAMIAAGISIEDATRLLIRLADETAHSVERIFALVALMRSVNRAVAYRLIMQVAGESAQPATRRSQLQRTMDPSGTPVRPGAAKPDSRSVLDEVRRTLRGKREQG
ncbi:DUF2336 domain-containing protein [Bosea caraganae]|uniref:DUF2336 domain-containing protein n=1 Tax=Bosea caraganae TaxID=2763117 RepID=A0A370KZJ5_9HYPH|nr:DUF2336 domain-containing protein [Bosea caraganae]RDJ20423.1 DUF2336 domain-containing protein [Bosea caraganae]RDJ29939.1 DUF2336 domain-containing protein [Bosea caraganae]